MSGMHRRLAAWVVAMVGVVAVAGAVLAVVGSDRLDQVRPAILVLLGVVGLAAAIGWFMIARPITRRIQRAIDGADRLAAGDTDGGLDDRSVDELGDLYRSIDRVGERLAEARRERDQAEQRLDHERVNDPLTGASSRPHLMALVGAGVGNVEDPPVSLVVVDMDEFRAINDVWGHAVGDQVLVGLAGRLGRVIGAHDTLCRWGGDRFVIMAVGAEPAPLVASIRDALVDPMPTTAGPIAVSASIGVASSPADAQSADALISLAEHRAIDEKAGHVAVRDIGPVAAGLVESIVDGDGLELWYQPIVEMRTPHASRIVGAEALLRVRSESGELVAPHAFLDEILMTPFGRAVDRAIAERAVAHLASWHQEALLSTDFLVSLNLSPASLSNDDLASALDGLCRSYGIEPNEIVLDVSEEAGDLDQIVAAELRRSGFRLSIDDLGLKRSNFDRLFTIGAEFAKLHPRWLDDEVMLDALITICQRKGLQVVAEGVESMDQLQALFGRGVRLVQGFVIAKPMPHGEFVQLLQAGRPNPASI